jgi:hypothetical protein
VDVKGKAGKYDVWVAWSAEMVATPDGGAWAFFSAAARPPEGDGDNRLYASHFDPATGTWSRAQAMPGGRVQFGPSAAVDAAGHVHLVYSDRKADKPDQPSVLVYTTEDGKGGWTTPQPVAPDRSAGHQISPSLAIDGQGTLHVVWQDQRAWSASDRIASAANADIFASERPAGGAWTKAVMLNKHQAGEVGSRPHVVVDGDRLVAVWSIYTTKLGLEAAARIEWSTRSLAKADAAWAKATTLIAGRGEAFGGRLLDLKADPAGGVVLAFGRRATDTFLFVRRLPMDSTTWGGDVLITYGDRGTFPSLAINDEGTLYLTYNLGEGALVDVGATALAHGSVNPGPEENLTSDEPETQGRPIVTVDTTGAPWVLYLNAPQGGNADEVRILRAPPVPLP